MSAKVLGPAGLIGELERVPLFASLQKRQLESLSRHLRRRAFKRGEVIFFQGDIGESLYIIESGSVRITQQSEDGRELILVVFGAGDFFGDMSIIDGEPRSATAIAAEDASALMLLRDDFVRFIGENPGAALETLKVLSRRLRRMDEVLSEAVFHSATVRLARRLIELTQIYGRPSDGGTLIDSRITQSQLAEMAGTSRVTINKELALLEARGILKRVKRKILILDVRGLQDLSS